MSARCHLSDNAIVRKKKDINSIDAFINTYVRFFMYSLQFFIYSNEVFKIISFSFQHDIFCQSILFNCFISYFEIFHSYIAFL